MGSIVGLLGSTGSHLCLAPFVAKTFSSLHCEVYID